MARRRLYDDPMWKTVSIRVPSALLARCRRSKVNMSAVTRHALEKAVMDAERLRARK